MTPTVPASPEDRKRTLADMVVTCGERAGQSASRWHLVRAGRRPAALPRGAKGPAWGSGHAAPSSQMRTLRLGEGARAGAGWEAGLCSLRSGPRCLGSAESSCRRSQQVLSQLSSPPLCQES